MCDCLTRFQTNKPALLSLPLDPIELLCVPSPELVIEYKQISGQWNVYVQKLLMGVINHDGAHLRKRTPNVIETIKKKRGRRPKMTETQKRSSETHFIKGWTSNKSRT
jgi:hypothetical protein